MWVGPAIVTVSVAPNTIKVREYVKDPNVTVIVALPFTSPSLWKHTYSVPSRPAERLAEVELSSEHTTLVSVTVIPPVAVPVRVARIRPFAAEVTPTL
jgi:hypothetical protein